jgi:hypothetical protein
MDPYILLALITAGSSLVVSILTHVKHSKCWNCEIETRDNGLVSERRPLLTSQPESQDEIITPERSSKVTFEEKTIQAL